ncbi:MAG: STAS domain-containing protein [Actinobacteria bacterium]|nr:STAS domain-containing protein [Actinomycetota bacterium]
MTSTAEVRNGVCFVTLAGEFDRGNVAALKTEIETCLEQASSVVFDFGAVTFANGAVMSLLFDIIDRLEKLGEGGWLGVARPVPVIERLFKVTGLVERPNFRIIPTLREALDIIENY